MSAASCGRAVSGLIGSALEAADSKAAAAPFGCTLVDACGCVLRAASGYLVLGDRGYRFKGDRCHPAQLRTRQRVRRRLAALRRAR